MTMAELIDHLATDYRERYHPEAKARRAEERQEKKKQTEVVKTPTAPGVEGEEVKTDKKMEVSSSSSIVPPVQEVSTNKRAPSDPIIHKLTRSNEGYQCSYVDETTKKRCASRYRLEIDHIHAWSHGGKTELTNLRYLCANHHRRVSFLQFGESTKYFNSKRE